MITPQFTLSQTDTHLNIEIRTPHIKAKDVSLFVEENLFILSVTPYYLRLTLPGSVIEDDSSSAKYDISSGILSISLTKVIPGDHFPDLDLTNRLLARTGEKLPSTLSSNTLPAPKIQVLSEISSPSTASTEQNPFSEALEFDFQIPQTIPAEATLSTDISTGSGYGFNNQYKGSFNFLQNPDVLTVEEPEGKSWLERWIQMRDLEEQKFDFEWCCADELDSPDELKEILEFEVDEGMFEVLSTEEQSFLRGIGNKEFLIDNVKDIYLNLPPLIFAILYDKVTTLSSPTPESPWTISRISPTLSSLAPSFLPPQSPPQHPSITLSPTPSLPSDIIQFSHLPPLHQQKLCLLRRVLTFPLYRSETLFRKLYSLTIRFVRSRRAILRLLLSAREIFMDGEWSVYNRILWEDYIIWIQFAVKEKVLGVLAGEMEKVGEIGVEDCGFREGGDAEEGRDGEGRGGI